MEESGRLGADEIEALHREQIAKLESFELPLYGIDQSRRGTRYADGVTERRSVDPQTGETIMKRFELALVHGDPDVADQPYVRVATTTDPDATMPWRLVVRVEPTPFEDRISAIADADYTPPGATRLVLDIPLDGQPAEFELLRRGPHFVAQHHAGTHDIVIEGRSFEPAELSLATVKDLQPYIDGFWARHRRQP